MNSGVEACSRLGIDRAVASGLFGTTRVHELKAQGMRPTDIAKALKIGRASAYRMLGTAPGA
jgi:hypothetical protein